MTDLPLTPWTCYCLFVFAVGCWTVGTWLGRGLCWLAERLTGEEEEKIEKDF